LAHLKAKKLLFALKTGSELHKFVCKLPDSVLASAEQSKEPKTGLFVMVATHNDQKALEKHVLHPASYVFHPVWPLSSREWGVGVEGSWQFTQCQVHQNFPVA
jgi:hypothetical protein